jgi:mono/diheme cytochrome c family protein
MKRLLPLFALLGLLAFGQSPGARIFSANCQTCHQANGQGLPGAFPPLTHLDKVVQAKGGREYLVRVVALRPAGPPDRGGQEL